jgi:hypothetical protein
VSRADRDPATAALRRLAAARNREILAAQRVGAAVIAARQAGATWTSIAATLGVSKQAVQQRFGWAVE